MTAVIDREPAVTPARLELATRVSELRACGLSHAQVGKKLGISRSYASILATDPDGSAARHRKDSYGGTCERCGGPTSGGEGPKRVADRCQACTRALQQEQKHWTREAVIAAIRRWNDEHGCPPKSTDWNHADHGVGYPATTSVYRTSTNPGCPFATWADAIEAAGFPRPEQGRRDGERRWSPDLVITEIRRITVDGFASSYHQNVLCNYAHVYFGSWRAACAAAGVRPSSERRAREREAVSPTRRTES